MELYYKNPAKCWLEGFALGNGRMGAVIHGALDHEVLQLNEDTLWGVRSGLRPVPRRSAG